MFTLWLIPWQPFALWNSKTKALVNFLGTTIVGSTVYFDMTTFLKMLFLSSRKLVPGLVFISFILLLQNQSLVCLSLASLHCMLVSSVRWTSSIMFLTTSSVMTGISLLPLSWYRPRVLNQDTVSTTTFFLPWICWNLMLNCWSSRAHLPSTGLWTYS